MMTKLAVATVFGAVLVGGLSANANAFEGRGFRGGYIAHRVFVPRVVVSGPVYAPPVAAAPVYGYGYGYGYSVSPVYPHVMGPRWAWHRR